MCCLFGIYDYNNYFNKKQRNTILSILSTECEARGTDATGIAYNANGKLNIFKRPLPAHKIRYQTPDFANVIMGHTRMATQGSRKRNYNNHPFSGRAGNTLFAFAHNGIIYNDVRIRKDKKLPDTKIQTDSYIAVQLLEQESALTFQSLAKMAETVDGSFTFTILDNGDNLYFVKGDNPLCIYHFASAGFYIYASTKEILDKALKRLRLNKKAHEELPSRCGDIIRIDTDGNITTSKFDTSALLSLHCNCFRPYRCSFYERFYDYPDCDYPDNEHLQIVREMAGAFGYSPDDVDCLLSEGYTLDEIEETFYEIDMSQ